jgi:hypothetical protein
MHHGSEAAHSKAHGSLQPETRTGVAGIWTTVTYARKASVLSNTHQLVLMFGRLIDVWAAATIHSTTIKLKTAVR